MFTHQLPLFCPQHAFLTGRAFDPHARVSSMIVRHHRRVSLPLLTCLVLSLIAPATMAKVTPKGWFGVSLAPATAEEQAALGIQRPVPRVRSVFKDSPAEKSGVMPGDFVLQLQGVDVGSVKDLVQRVGATPPGTQVAFLLGHSDGRSPTSIQVVLDLRPNLRQMNRDQQVGLPLPVMRVGAQDGSVIQLGADAGAGKVWILDYFATWCGPCKRFSPVLARLQKEYGPSGLEVLGVSAEGWEVLGPYLGKHATGYRVASDIDGQLRRELRAQVMPTIWLVDRSGVIREVFYGAGSGVELEALVQRALAPPPRDSFGRVIPFGR